MKPRAVRASSVNLYSPAGGASLLGSSLSHLSRAVIAITEASCDQAVVKVTQGLARRFGAEVYLLRVDPPAGVDAGQKLAWLFSEDEGLNRLAAVGPVARLEPLEQKIVFDNVRWIRVESAHPTAAAAQFALEQHADLLVLETHVSHGLGRPVFGGTAGEIARWTTCPVLSLPRAWAREHGAAPFRHILAPIDFSEQSAEGLRTALLLAERFGARVSVLFVKEQPVVTRLRGGRIRREVRRVRPDTMRTAEATLHDFCAPETETSDVPVEMFVRAGSIASHILDTAAESDADLIVISSHGLTGETRYALGSVCDRVLRRAACPVLLLKSKPDPGSRNDLS